jgi:predicted ATPase
MVSSQRPREHLAIRFAKSLDGTFSGAQMITKWKLGNFKSVRDTTELLFAPVTIFAGPNSSGKSSWIQSILMVSQTLAHRVGSRSMVLNGVLARLGQFDDLRSFGSAKSHIEVGWECSPHSERIAAGYLPSPSSEVSARHRRGWSPISVNEIRSVSCDLLFDAEPSQIVRQVELTQLHPRILSCSLTCRTEDEEAQEIKSSVSIQRAPDINLKEAAYGSTLESEVMDARMLLDTLQFDVELDQNSLAEVREQFPSAHVRGCGLRHFLPDRLTVEIESISEKARVVGGFLQSGNMRAIRMSQFSDQDLIIPFEIVELLREKLVPRILPSLPETIASEGMPLRDWIEALRSVSPTKRYSVQEELRKIPLEQLVPDSVTRFADKELILRSVDIPDPIRDSERYLDHFFTTSISYLGPLRDEPKPVYPLPTSPDLTYVGLKGEFTAAVLDLHKFRYIEYVPPTCFTESAFNPSVQSSSLHAAISDWLQYLGVAESVHTQDRGKLGHELQVKTSGVEKVHDLTHAGVGVSQVLPILVTCLLSRYDATLLIEQPELHLHPKVQSRLGDFFMSMAFVGKQCVIETHSEYLVNRLRFRIACAPAGAPLGSLTKIYFVEKHEDSSTYSEVVVNEYGAIQQWPRGFFDESQNEAEQIIRAASSKRQAKVNGSKDDKRND